MRPLENTEKLVADTDIDTNAETDQAVLGTVLKAFENSKTAKSALSQPSIWRAIAKGPIPKLAAALVVVAFVLFTTNRLNKKKLSDMETSPRYILADYQNNHFKETKPCDILPPLPDWFRAQPF